MSITTFIVLGIAAAVILYAILVYNNLVRLKHNVNAAWSNIDVLLKQRHDELPKLVETCKQYMAYEKDVLESVTKARSMVANARSDNDVTQLGRAETALRRGLGNLFAVAERYPELSADDKFQHLQARISNLEAQIADRREFYNDSVNINNIRIEQFPDILLARFFRFVERELLEFDEASLRDPDVKALFAD